jgi:DNA-directed RNA polymerase specialized sigma24 family protein
VARHRAVDTLRHHRHCPAGLIEDGAALVDPGPGPAADCERLSDQAQVKRVLTELSAQVSARNFQVLHLRFIEGRTSAEVADAFGAEVTLYINLVRRALYDEMPAYNCLKGTLLLTADTWRTWEAIDSSPLSLFL